MSNPASCFTTFNENIDNLALPEQFTFPFYYKPHPLAVAAAKQLQQQLKKLDKAILDTDDIDAGKMFGVLVVQDESQQLGFISAYSGQHAVRIFTDSECRVLDTECRGFLMFVEQTGVINSTTREMVMDRLAALDNSAITLEDLKWLILMVLFNAPDSQQAYEQMEDLIFDEPSEVLH